MNYYDVYGCGRVEESKVEFMNVFSQMHHRTLLTPDRLWILWAMARYTLELEGDLAECGTYLGGSSKMMYAASEGKKHLNLFDTFSGIPQQYIIEGNRCRGGEFAVSEADVRSTLSGCEKLTIFPGLVPGTLVNVQEKKFSLVHLDMDVYEPTLEASKFFWERLVPGGVIVYDDYGCIEPVTKGVEEFAQSIGVTITNTAMMQCALQKS